MIKVGEFSIEKIIVLGIVLLSLTYFVNLGMYHTNVNVNGVNTTCPASLSGFGNCNDYSIEQNINDLMPSKSNSFSTGSSGESYVDTAKIMWDWILSLPVISQIWGLVNMPSYLASTFIPASFFNESGFKVLLFMINTIVWVLLFYLIVKVIMGR